MAQVFVVDRAALFGGDWPQGYHRLDDADAFLQRAHRLGRFVDRDEAEQNPAWKQWIPYCMLRCGAWHAAATPATGGRDDDRGVLLVQRTRKQSEARLHESWSIGLGGHIEPEDRQAADAAGVGDAAGFFATALWRELTEELQLPPDTSTLGSPRLLGLINDDSTAVGQVHAGLAYCMDLQVPLRIAREQVGIREISKMRGAFTSLVDFAELWQTPAQFESWSQFLVRAEIAGAMGDRSWNGARAVEGQTSVENDDRREP